MEFSGGLVTHEARYFAVPFASPASPAALADPMPDRSRVTALEITRNPMFEFQASPLESRGLKLRSTERPSGGVMPGGGPGIPGWFIVLFVIVAVLAVGGSIWRYSVLRSGGLNPFVAREQLEARLNQTLTAAVPGPGQSIEQRLAELTDLHTRGVITDEELSAGRAKIIAGE